MSLTGVVIDGQLAANSIDRLQADLATNGLMLQSASLNRHWNLPLASHKAVSKQEFYLFNQEFIALLRAGLALPAILELLSNRKKQQALQEILTRIQSDIRQGIALSKACAEFPDVFDKMYISSLLIGERTGDFVPVLKRYQEYLQLRLALTKKVQQALAYPLFLMLTMVVILFVLFIFVLPRFVTMYTSFDAELPAPTRVLINIIEHSHIYIPLFLVSALFSYMCYQIWLTRNNARLIRDRLILKLPLVGRVLKLHIISQISRTLSTLMASGIPLVDTIKTTAGSINNQFYAEKLRRVVTNVQAGESFSAALDENALFPETSIKMIQAAEISGELASMFGEVALYHEETLEYMLARLMSYIEPLIMLLMGVFVGGIIFVMYLPIFSIADVIK